MKIAIIGTGISGLGAAHLLHQRHEVTVYEPNAYAGGHSRTIDISVDGASVPVDTGFIVFNKKNYPLLTQLFERLKLPVIKSDMSFGASIANGHIEYGSKSMFAQTANLLRPAFWGMVFDILRFNRKALAFISGREDITLRQCLTEMRMGEWFRRYYLQAMGAAIWSCSVETILDFPAASFLRFFENHGLLTVNDQPQWYTVQGGSREYVARLTVPLEGRIHLNCGAAKVRRLASQVEVMDTLGRREAYDHVLFACHADEALVLLEAPTGVEREVLSAFRYQENHVVVHSDESFMPRTRGCWASWVYLSEGGIDAKPVVSLSYWMNQLQALNTKKPVLITLNPGRAPKSELTYDKHSFSHPVFTLETLRAQKRMAEIQGKDRISWCGAYLRYGFHEDGLMSAVVAANALGGDSL